jgi:hypothetical protein
MPVSPDPPDEGFAPPAPAPVAPFWPPACTLPGVVDAPPYQPPPENASRNFVLGALFGYFLGR